MPALITHSSPSHIAYPPPPYTVGDTATTEGTTARCAAAGGLQLLASSAKLPAWAGDEQHQSPAQADGEQRRGRTRARRDAFHWQRPSWPRRWRRPLRAHPAREDSPAHATVDHDCPSVCARDGRATTAACL